MLNVLKNVYYSLPSWSIAYLKYIPDNVLFGKSYVNTVVSTETNDIGTRLHEQLKYVREHTAYGREHIPSDFVPTEAEQVLETLPALNPDDITANIDYFSSDEYSSLNSYLTTTGGSGRNPTSIRLSNESYAVEWAHIHWIWHHGGYERRKDLKLTMRGYHFPKGQFFRYNPLYNELALDSFQLNDKNFDAMLAGLRKYPVKCIHGYPSFVKMFMERLRSHGERLHVKCVFLGSEEASVDFKREAAEFFDARVLSWYGQSEKVVLAADLDQGGRFVNLSSYGYPSIIDGDENGFGEIAGTTFVNMALPLVRYRTGDFGRLKKSDDGWFLEDVRGRWGKDFVYLSPSEKFPTTAINLHSDIQRKILFFQIIQEKYAEITIVILPKSEYTGQGEELINGFDHDLGDKLKQFKVSYKIVNDEREIVRSIRGKKIMLVQNIKTESGTGIP